MIQSDAVERARSSNRATVNDYRLRCTDCGFETTVEGDSFDALAAVEAHQEAYEEPFADHFVNFSVDD